MNNENEKLTDLDYSYYDKVSRMTNAELEKELARINKPTIYYQSKQVKTKLRILWEEMNSRKMLPPSK